MKAGQSRATSACRKRRRRRSAARTRSHPIAALQTEYSLWSREPRPRCCRRCASSASASSPTVPLGRGFLTGQFKSLDDLPADDCRRNIPRFQGENFEKNLELVREVEALAQEKGCTPAQLALAWVLAQGDDIVPIPGTKRVKYLDDNLGALDVTLTAEELEQIDAILPPGAAAGERYHASGMATVNR